MSLCKLLLDQQVLLSSRWFTKEFSVVKEKVLLFNLCDLSQPLNPIILEGLKVKIADFDSKNEQYVACNHKNDEENN